MDDCKQSGLKVIEAGQVDTKAPGYFLPLSIVDNPPDSSRIVREERRSHLFFLANTITHPSLQSSARSHRCSSGRTRTTSFAVLVSISLLTTCCCILIMAADDSEYALGAVVWGKDVARASKVASRLQAGTVWINNAQNLHPLIGFGGHKVRHFIPVFAYEEIDDGVNSCLVSASRAESMAFFPGRTSR